MTENNTNTVVQKQPTFRIRNITVSLEIADKSYGDGNSGYVSISAYVDEANLGQIGCVVDAGLDLFVAAWQAIIAGKTAVKLLGMGAQELRDTVAAVQRRTEKVRTLLRDGNTDFEKREDKAAGA